MPKPLENNSTQALQIQKLFTELTQEERDLALAVLQKNEDLTRALFSKKYGKLLIGTYDWLVIVLMLALGFATDLIASAHNTNASSEWDTVFIGIASSIIVLVSHIDSWFKQHFIGADSAIGILFALDRLFKSIMSAMAGSKYINLPGWMNNVFMIFMIFLSKEYVSSATAIILYINLALNCIVLNSYYPLFMMMVMLLYVRGDFSSMDRFLRSHKRIIAAAFVLLLAVVFGYVQFKTHKEEPFVQKMINWWIKRASPYKK